ncbi:hypothetical protein X897_3285 [Burkholderia pseudomallei ABCPW 30]|nr:hypothetical protein X897_3285 [Burkholderia pseudomallei ABCPW 30]
MELIQRIRNQMTPTATAPRNASIVYIDSQCRPFCRFYFFIQSFR